VRPSINENARLLIQKAGGIAIKGTKLENTFFSPIHIICSRAGCIVPSDLTLKTQVQR